MYYGNIPGMLLHAQLAPDQQTGQGPSPPPQQVPPEIPAPEQPLQPQTAPLRPIKIIKETGQKKGIQIMFVAGAVIIIAAVAALILMHGGGTTRTTTSTMGQVSLSQISSCQNIVSPGSYYVDGKVQTSIQNGTCIDVLADNVSIICNRNSISGSGPYVITPPYTYGILVDNRTNVSIDGCEISNFSFGVYIGFSSRISVASSNVSRNYLSDIWLQNASDNRLYGDYLSGNPSQYGALSIDGNSVNDTVVNNTLKFDSQVGIAINSTGDSFINNSVTATPLSFYCGEGTGFKSRNYASGNLCYNSTGCSFLQCKGTNIQPDTRTIRLSSSISSCGAIESAGRYYLYGNIDMGKLVNTSESTLPCINILASGVILDCNGHTILNATTGIDVSAAGNADITNCNVRDSSTGISVESSSNTNLTNVAFYNDSVSGISLTDSDGAYMENVTARGNAYGISLSNTQDSTLYGFSIENNTYGIYLAGSLGNAFEKGSSTNNTKVDVYATRDSLSASDNAWQKSTCTSTDADWASNCPIKISPSLQYYPVQACGTLSRPGVYYLETNLVGITGSCFNIAANGTTLDCNGHLLLNPSHAGTAIASVGRSSTFIENCSISGFATGVLASGPQLSVVNVSVDDAITGINLSRSAGSILLNDNVSHSYNYSIYLSNVSRSVIRHNLVELGLVDNTGILVNGSADNLIENNTMSSAGFGMAITGSSNNNTISDNVASENIVDYACDYQNSQLNSEFGGINYGTTKQGCGWMAELLQLQQNPGCSTNTKPTSYFLTNDYIYTYGATCFDVDADSTVIDCEGHTVTATHGGTFADFENSNGKSLVENCDLIGFTSPIMARNSSVSVINNTIYANASVARGSTAIDITNSSNVHVDDNLILASEYGIALNRVSYGTVSNNTVNASGYAYSLNGVQYLTVLADSALSYLAESGMYLNNSLHDTFASDYFNGLTGLECTGTSMQARGNIDSGQNYCSSSSGCLAWLNSSLQGC